LIGLTKEEKKNEEPARPFVMNGGRTVNDGRLLGRGTRRRQCRI